MRILASRESWTGLFAVVERDCIRVRALPTPGANLSRPDAE